jgi:hypothetical protein
MEAKRPTLPFVRALDSQALTTVSTAASSTWFLGAIVFLVTWGGGIVLLQAPSIDFSFHAGLNMAAVRGLHYGSEIVFTYGPLGFLKSYLVFYEWPARLAGLYGIALQLALSVSLVWALRRNFGILIGVALALVVAMFARGDESSIAIRDDGAVIILALLWCVAALSAQAPELARRIVVYGGGPLAAIEVLAKLNTGIVVVALVAVTVIAIEGNRRRNLAICALTFLGTATALWFAAGQGTDDVGPYLSGSWEIISGYSSGARMDWQVREYDYWLAPMVVAVTALIAWIATADRPWGRRVPILLIVAIVAFTAAKSGFVAHDIYHMAVFYTTMLGTALVLPLPPRPRLRAAVVVVAGGIAAAILTTSVFPGYPLANPLANVRNGAETVATLVDTSRLDGEIARNRAALIADYHLDSRSLELLRGHSVHVNPSETAAAWAYRLDWQPLPVFQPYAAWTPDLDRRNAEALASPAGPQRILRQNLNALGRYPAFESPAAMIAMLCNFRATRTTTEWQVLARVPNRCGEPAQIGSATGRYGTPIPIPEAPANSVVFGRVYGVQDSGFARLRALLIRTQSRQVRFAGDPRRYTFVPGTAEDGLLLRAPRRLDFPEPFALAPNSGEVTFLRNGGPADDPITIDFYSMAVRP